MLALASLLKFMNSHPTFSTRLYLFYFASGTVVYEKQPLMVDCVTFFLIPFLCYVNVNINAYCISALHESKDLSLSIFYSLKEWIMEQWEKNYYISAIAGANNGSSLVVMSKGQSKFF